VIQGRARLSTAQQPASLYFQFFCGAGCSAAALHDRVAPKATKRWWWWWSQRSKFTRLRFSSAVCLAVCQGFRQSGTSPQTSAARAAIVVSARQVTAGERPGIDLKGIQRSHTAASRLAYRVESSAITGQRPSSAKAAAHTTGHIASNQTREC